MDFEARRNPWEAKAIANAGKPFICGKPVSDNLAGSVTCSQAAARARVLAAMGLDRRLMEDFAQVFGLYPERKYGRRSCAAMSKGVSPSNKGWGRLRNASMASRSP